MSINPIGPSGPPARIDSDQQIKDRSSQVERTAAADPVDRVDVEANRERVESHVSSGEQDPSGGNLDAERIAEIRARLESGVYNDHAVREAVVAGVLADYGDLLSDE